MTKEPEKGILWFKRMGTLHSHAFVPNNHKSLCGQKDRTKGIWFKTKAMFRCDECEEKAEAEKVKYEMAAWGSWYNQP